MNTELLREAARPRQLVADAKASSANFRLDGSRDPQILRALRVPDVEGKLPAAQVAQLECEKWNYREDAAERSKTGHRS